MLCDDKENTVFWAVLHQYWEISILLNLDISSPLDLLLTRCRVTNLHDMQFLCGLACFLLTETEQGVLVTGCISDWHISECGSESLQNLLLSFVNKEQLHVTANSAICSLIDSNEIAPLVR